jgi:hypothetical protein
MQADHRFGAGAADPAGRPPPADRVFNAVLFLLSRRFHRAERSLTQAPQKWEAVVGDDQAPANRQVSIGDQSTPIAL